MAHGDGIQQSRGDDPSGHAAFISYASQDKAVAEALVETLERDRIACWIAPRDVTAGALYADAIVRAISSARFFIVVLSAHSIASAHVGKEIERASSKQRPIIALRVDAAPLSPALEYFLSESQWVDLDPGNPGKAYARLIEAIRAPRVSSSLPPAMPLRTDARRSRWALLSVIVVLAVIGALLAGRLPSGRRPEAVAPAVPAAIPASSKSVAVLPFTDLSEKKDQEYLAEGIAEDIIGRLARVPGLRVVGRTSSFQFRDKGTDTAKAGTTLGVSYLLEGSVRREARRIRVTAQLLEAQNGSQRWSDHFDADVVNLFQVQDSIATEIARALQVAVQSSAAKTSTVSSAEAVDIYLRGLQAADRSTAQSLEAAVADFKEALSIDPNFAPALNELARAYAFIGSEGWQPSRIAFEQARDTAMRAQRLDPQSPAPHLVLAHVNTIYDWDWAGAERELKRALELGSHTADGVDGALILAAAGGHWATARRLAIEAAELDPLNPDIPFLLGWTIHMRSGQYQEAEQSIRHGLQIAPAWGSGEYMLGEALMLQGHYEAALVEFGKETLGDGQLEGSAMAQFAAGHKRRSDMLLAAAIRQNGTSWPSEIARVYAFRGDKDRAMEWLEKGYQLRDEDMYLIKDDPLLKSLWTDPRYQALLTKMNFPAAASSADLQ